MKKYAKTFEAYNLNEAKNRTDIPMVYIMSNHDKPETFSVYTKEAGINGREKLGNDKFTEKKAEAFAKRIIERSPKAYSKGMEHYGGKK